MAESLKWGLKMASVQNRHGETVSPDMVEQGVNIAMEYNKEDLGQKMVADLIDTPEHKAYPLATFTYIVFNISTTPGITCDQMKVRKNTHTYCRGIRRMYVKQSSNVEH